MALLVFTKYQLTIKCHTSAEVWPSDDMDAPSIVTLAPLRLLTEMSTSPDRCHTLQIDTEQDVTLLISLSAVGLNELMPIPRKHKSTVRKLNTDKFNYDEATTMTQTTFQRQLSIHSAGL